jgi:hypothetical protein
MEIINDFLITLHNYIGGTTGSFFFCWVLAPFLPSTSGFPKSVISDMLSEF